MRSVCVYCASSRERHPIYHDVARQLGGTRAYFDPLIQLLNRAVSERFMDERHLQMWQVVEFPEEVPHALEHAPAWSAEARKSAAV